MSDRDPDSVSPDTKSPLEWAKLKDHYSKPRRGEAPQSLLSSAFQVADRLYRWSEHDYHFQLSPFQLSESDFDEAMVASGMYPVAELHDAALSPYGRSLTRPKDSK